MKRFYFTVLSAVFLIHWVTAQFSVDGDLRTRTELRNGYMLPATDTSASAFFTSQRSRVTLHFQKERIEFRFGIQDVRVWGQDDKITGSGTFGDTRSLSTSESWLQYTVADSLNIKLGRQVLSYDNHRIFSSRDWNQNGVFYDAVLFSYKNIPWAVDLGFSFNNTADNLFNIDYYHELNKFQTLNFMHLENRLTDNLSVSGLFVNTGYNNPDKRNSLLMMYTGGSVAVFSAENVSASAEGYYQFGKNSYGKNVSAYFFSVSGLYTLLPKTLKIGAGVDYFSGHDATRANAGYRATDHTFDIMYGARFKYYGYLNQYMFVGKSFEQGGLQDVSAQLVYIKNKRHTVKLMYHYFSLTNTVVAADSFRELDAGLGSEIDAMYVFKINQIANLNVGGAYYASSDSFSYVKGVAPGLEAPSYYAWVALQFTPQIFDSEKSKF